MSEQMLKREDIRTDGGTQSRAAINEATVADYAEAMEDAATVFPPVVVYYDGRDYWLADGFHRLAAWERIGREEVPADVRQGDRRRAILHSCAANAAHGLRRSNADKRRAVTTLLEDEEWSQWSNREIARRCGVGEALVRSLRSERSEDNAPRTYTTKHGTEAQMDTSRIGRRGDEILPAREPADVSAADKPGISVGDVPAGGPGQMQQPAQPAKPAGEPEPSEAGAEDAEANTAPDPHAEARKRLAKLTREGLEDEVLGLRDALEDEKARRKVAEAERDKFKARWQEATTEDMGRALGTAQRARDTAKGRLNEELAKNARQARRIKLLEAELAQAKAALERQEIRL